MVRVLHTDQVLKNRMRLENVPQMSHFFHPQDLGTARTFPNRTPHQDSEAGNTISKIDSDWEGRKNRKTREGHGAGL